MYKCLPGYETNVMGIPCRIDVSRFSYESATFDCPGGGDFEFELYDRKGYRAKWLERKLETLESTNLNEYLKITDRLFETHLEYLREDDGYDYD